MERVEDYNTIIKEINIERRWKEIPMVYNKELLYRLYSESLRNFVEPYRMPTELDRKEFIINFLQKDL